MVRVYLWRKLLDGLTGIHLGVPETAAGDEIVKGGKSRIGLTLFYDLTQPPPVLRNMGPSEVQIGEGTRWRHSSVVTSYTDAELASVLTYLRAVVR